MKIANLFTALLIFLISLSAAEAYYVSVSPNPANTNDNLVCNTDAPSPYFYWYNTNNLGSVISTSNSLQSYITTRYNTYRCVVKRYLGTQGFVTVGTDDRYISNAPPQITLFILNNGTVNVPVNLFSAAIDIDNDALTYSWTFGNGGTSNQQNPSPTYASPGNYTVSLTVADGQGGSASASGVVDINQLPAAQQNYTINFSSVQNNNLTQNLPTFSFNSVNYTLPNGTTVPSAIYNITYSPQPGFAFVNWTATPLLTVANITNNVTTVNVTGNGTLTAVYADVQPPNVTIWSPLNQTYNVSTVLINITATDNVAVDQIWYTLDGGANTTFTVPVNSSLLVNGPHGLVAYANDTSGNINSTFVNFTINSTTPPVLYNISLNSTENNSLTSNLGTIDFNLITYSLPNQTATFAGVYNLSFNISLPYNFSYWNTTGGVTVANISAISTNATVVGNGTITAVYYNLTISNQTNQSINYTINLSSQQDNLSTSNLGQIVLNSTTYGLPNLTTIINGTYGLSFNISAPYNFMYWNSSGAAVIGNTLSNVTNVTISGNASIWAVYNATANVTNSTNTTNLPPNVTLVIPPSGTNFTTNNVSLTFNVTDDQSTTLANCTLYLNGFVNQTYISVGNNTSPVFNLSNLANGIYNWSISCFDGNLTGYSQNWTFGVNTSAPVVNYTIGLYSTENNSATSNLGSISFNAVTYGLSNQTTAPTGIYAISFTPAAGYNFSSWNSTPGLIVTSATANPTTVFVSGTGNLTAIYFNATAGTTNSTNGTNTTNNTAPIITLLWPTNPLQINNTQIVQFNFTAVDDFSASMNCMLYVDGSNVNSGSLLNNTIGSWTIGPFAFGAHMWNVSCTDGNLTGYSPTWIFTLVNTSVADTIPPVITLVAPTPANNTVTTVNSLFVNATVIDNVAVSTAKLELDGANYTMFGGGNNWFANLTGLSIGTHYYKVYANDTSNNWGVSETRRLDIITLTNTAPGITLNAPANATQFNNNQQITFSFTATDDFSPTMSCNYFIDGANVGSNASVLNNTATTFTRNVSYGYNHTWYVSCSDGSLSNSSQTWMFDVVDTIAPNLTIVSPVAQVYTTTNILVNISAADINLNSVQYRIDGGSAFTYTSSFFTTLTNGTHNVSATATDTFGNIATASVTFTINTTGFVSGYVNDSYNRIWNATVELKQGTATIATAYTDVDGNYSFSAPAGVYNISVLKTGYNPATVSTLIFANLTTAQPPITLTASSGSGAVLGTVYDFPAFSTIANATVYIAVSGTNNVVQIVKSNSLGNYRINGLVTSNSYDLWANKPPTYLNSYLNQTAVLVPAGGTATGKDLVIS